MKEDIQVAILGKPRTILDVLMLLFRCGIWVVIGLGKSVCRNLDIASDSKQPTHIWPLAQLQSVNQMAEG